MTESPRPTPEPKPVSRRRATQWNLFFRYGMLVLTIVRNFVLVPLFFYYIGGTEYRAWLASGAVAVQLLAIDFGLMGALSQLTAAAYGRRDMAHVQQLISTGLVVAAAISGTVTVVGVVLAFFVPRMIGVTGESAANITGAFLVVSVANGIQLIAIGLRAVLNSLQRPFGPGLQSLVGEIAALIMTVVLLHLGFGLQSIAIGMLIRATWIALACAVELYRVFRNTLGLRFEWSGGLWGRLWRLSTYQFLAQLSMRINISFPPFIIGVVVGPDVAGIYALTARAHDMVRTLVMMLGGSLNPALSHLFGEGKREQFGGFLLFRARLMVLIGAIGCAGVVAFNERFMGLWVGPENFAGQLVNVLLAVSVFVNILRSMTYDSLYCMGALKRTGVVVIVESVLRIPVMVALLTFAGVWGVPLSIALMQFSLVVVPFCVTLLHRLEFSISQLREFLRKGVGSLVVPVLISVPAVLLNVWVTNWSRLVAAAIAFIAVCGAWGLIWEWPLLRSIRPQKARTARPPPTS